MEILLKEIKKKRILVSIPFSLANFLAYLLQMMPNPLLTVDQVKSLQHDNIISGNYPVLKDLGITANSLKNILSEYIYRFRTGGQFG